MRLVQTQGPLNWVRISQQLATRTPKQCRERYHQNLKPNLNHEPISPEEGALIEQLVREIGKRWAEIARRLNNRSDNAVKNWWNGNQNRRKRMDRRKTTIPLQAAHPHSHAPYDHRGTMPVPAPDHSRMNMAVPRSLTLASQELSGRHLLPPIIATGYHDRSYGVETPLPSPSSHSPDSMSDMHWHYADYATSPGRFTTHSPVTRLPPLLPSHGPGYNPARRPSSATMPMENNILPPIQPMNCPGKPAHEFILAPMYPSSQAEYPSPRLTAPNSPVGFGDQPRHGAQEKDSRLKVANLLG